MKHLIMVALLSSAVNAYAFTSCNTLDSSFTISIYETNPVKILIMDKKLSVAPFSYLCNKSNLTENGERLAAYGCVGGGMGGDEKKIAIYVNESKRVANYQDLDNEKNDMSNLKCKITK